MTAADELADQRIAGIVSRGSAALVDLVVVLLVMGVLYGGLVIAHLAFSPRAFAFPSLSVVFSALGMAVVSIGYFTACWAVSGCTAGAVVMGLRVVGRRSGRLGLPVALLRAAGCVVFPLGLAWVAVDSRRRSVQDLVCGSRVIYDRRAAA